MASKVTFPETKKKITASKSKDSKSYRREITMVTMFVPLMSSEVRASARVVRHTHEM